MVSKKEKLEEQIAELVGAGKAVKMETVDFSNPNRALTCLEVDFPIIPINSVAVIEGNAGKPIYQMSKWWARRRSSVFRSLLLAAAIKAPKNKTSAAKKVWENYYANHQERNYLKHLHVADIFMGGGTTIVEGSRLGMKMHGVDINPVAWLVVKNEVSQVDYSSVEEKLHCIKKDVKPRVMPFYVCDCPRGHKGRWIDNATGKEVKSDFNYLSMSIEDRKYYTYEGPEVIYTFWAKHGPCQVSECKHLTPIMSSPIIAQKTLTVKCWPNYKCKKCDSIFDVEEKEARMAPRATLVLGQNEKGYSVLQDNKVTCPNKNCLYSNVFQSSGNTINKKVPLTLLVSPKWLKGYSSTTQKGYVYSGSPADSVQETIQWNEARLQNLYFLEVRGKLPDEIVCPITNIAFKTGKEGGNVPKKATFVCQNNTCGRAQNVLQSIKKTGETAPIAAYAIQGYCPTCDKEKQVYNGRFFDIPNINEALSTVYKEWEQLKDNELLKYWPKSELPYAYKTHHWGIPSHGYTHWSKMFNTRQILVLSYLLKAIVEHTSQNFEIMEFILGMFQQYLRNQNMFCFWNIQGDKLEPLFSNNNYHPKALAIENSVFSSLGRGNWSSCEKSSLNGLTWNQNPWKSGQTGSAPTIFMG